MDRPWQFWTTFNFNRDSTFESAERKLKLLEAMINREMLGQYWTKMPKEMRMQFVAFPESPTSHFHYHTFVHVPEPDRYVALSQEKWAFLVPGGQAFTEQPPTKADWRKVASYSTKWVAQQDLMEHIVFSGQL